MSGFPTLAFYLEDAGGAFTNNITAFVKLESGWDARRGRNDEDTAVEVGILNLTLHNDGRFTLGSASYNGIFTDKRIRVEETVGGVTTKRYTGYVQDWPTEWESPLGNYAICKIVASDRSSRLNRRKLRSVTEQEILADSPLVYYTLSEPTGSLSVGDTSGNGRAALSIVGTGTAPVFGAALNAWDGLTGCTFAGGPGFASGGIFTTSGTTLTIECEAAFNTVATQLFGTAILAGVSGVAIGVDFAGTGFVCGYEYDPTTTNITKRVISPLAYNDGQLHVYALTISGTTWTLYVDGTSVGTGVGAAITSGVMGDMKAGYGGFLYNQNFYSLVGTLAHLAVFGTNPSAARLLAHANAILNGFNTERSDQRIARLAGYAGIATADQNLETGVLATAAATLGPALRAQAAAASAVPLASNGQSAQAAMNDVDTAEGGNLFLAGDGKLTFHNRRHRTFKATGAAAATLTGADLEHTSFTFAADKNYLNNTATGSRLNGAEQRSVNAGSLLKYEEYPLDAGTVLMTTDQQVLDLLTWRTNTYNEVVSRVSQVTIDLLTLASSATVQALLALELGDHISISSLPTQSPVAAPQLIIEGVKEEQQLTDRSAKWTLTFNTAPASLFYAWILADTTYGVLGTTTKLHY